jgi:hypothetical protein
MVGHSASFMVSDILLRGSISIDAGVSFYHIPRVGINEMTLFWMIIGTAIPIVAAALLTRIAGLFIVAINVTMVFPVQRLNKQIAAEPGFNKWRGGTSQINISIFLMCANVMTIS